MDSLKVTIWTKCNSSTQPQHNVIRLTKFHTLIYHFAQPCHGRDIPTYNVEFRVLNLTQIAENKIHRKTKLVFLSICQNKNAQNRKRNLNNLSKSRYP